jgi:DNA invertase Pin-like site-specific DNA recombinase
MISSRTKAALAAAKARGKKLGGNRGMKLTAKVRAGGRAEVVKRATARAADLAPIIEGGRCCLVERDCGDAE